MATTPSGRYWRLRNRKIVDRYLNEARLLISSKDHRDVISALNLLDYALAISPRFEPALEMKARLSLNLRRFKDVADMLQDYIPSVRIAAEDSSDSLSSDNSLSRERVKLLTGKSFDPTRHLVKCFSVSDLKKKVIAGMSRTADKEGNWRYSILGQACCHLGLMEDAMVLLQTAKRLASAAQRKESVSKSEDSFSFNNLPLLADFPRMLTESEYISHLVSHIKLLLRRRSAALAALDAGLHSEAIRHFSKIVDSKRSAPQGFLAECYLNRATAYNLSDRVADSVSDCNRTLSLDPGCIPALTIRSSLFQSLRCFPDCLHDLEHLKILYNSSLRDRKLTWKPQSVSCREIPGRLCSLTAKIHDLKQRMGLPLLNIDYYTLLGLKRGCSRSDLERAYLLLCLRHKPDKAMNFIERCEFADNSELELVRDRARVSSFSLYKLIQKGYSSIKSDIDKREEEEEEAALKVVDRSSDSAFQGVFCRDMAVVSNLLLQVGFDRPLPVKYEGLSC